MPEGFYFQFYLFVKLHSELADPTQLQLVGVGTCPWQHGAHLALTLCHPGGGVLRTHSLANP